MAIFEYGYRMVVAMLWKAWRIRKRHWIRTLIEIASPVFLVLLLVVVKAVMEKESAEEDTTKPTHFIPHDMKYLIRQLCHSSCGGTDQIRSILGYAPNGPMAHGFVVNLMRKVRQILGEHAMEKLDVLGFSSEAEIEAYNAMLGVNNGTDSTGFYPVPTRLVGAIVFVNHPRRYNSRSGDLTYKIRLLDQKFITGKVFADMEFPGPGKHHAVYENSGFLGLQLAVDMAFIQTMHHGPMVYQVETQAFPYPPYKFQEKTHYTMIMSMLLPAAIIIGLSYMVTTITTEIVKEHETGVRIFMNMLGLSNVSYWLGWMFNFFIPATIAILFIVLLLTVNVTGDGAVLVYSSVPVLLLFLFAYLFASVWFVLFTSTFFSSSGFANSLGVLVWTGSFVVPALLIGNKQRFLGSQLMASILPNMCLYWGFHTIANWESRVVGIHWYNLMDYPTTVESMNLLLIILELIFDGFFYMFLTMFLRQHHECQRKRLKNPFSLFYDALYDDTKFPELINCLRRGFRCCCRKKRGKPVRDLGVDISESSAMGILRTKVLTTAGLTGTPLFNALRFDTNLFERETLSKTAGIKIRNVSKSYKGETVLKSLSCDFYKNEITVLLGPNGAGKTTLLNVLTGMMDAEDGTVYINRYDIRDYRLEARRSTGLCPQSDMLFEELTVMEHLMLFSWLKCGHWSESKNEAIRLVSQLDLKDVSKTQAAKLSAGQRRKLCFAIAVTGSPKVILLDEPSISLDAESRKSVWNVLQKMREGRTILLTTHSMEEADILADRIAIMSEGSLKCFGTPSFLRKAYGSGYTMKFRVTDGVKGERLLRIITTIMPRVEVKNRELTVGGEDISFVVPAAYASLFPDLFTQLFNRQEWLGIFSFDVHQTSIEEVFFGVKEIVEFQADGVKKKEELEENGEADKKKKNGQPPRKIMSILKLACVRLRILLKKQFWIAQVNTLFILCQYGVPLALVLSGVTGANRGFRNRDLDHFSEIKMKLDEYERPITLYNLEEPGLIKAFRAVVGKGWKSTKDVSISKTITAIGLKDETAYRHNYIVGAEQDDVTITAMYNSVPYHASSLSVNLVTNALMKFLEPNKTLKIVVENHPMQVAEKATLDTLSEEGVNAVIKSFCFYFSYALAIVCALVALRPLKEKANGAQHLQLMSGTHSLNFWFSYALVDGLYIGTLSATIVFVIWSTEESSLYTRDGGALALFLIFFLASFSCMNFAYFVTHLLKNPGASFGWFNMFHLLAAFGSFVIFQAHSGVDDALSAVIYWLCVPFPVPFAVHSLHTYAKIAIYNGRCAIVTNHILESICGKNGSFVYLPAYGCCPNCDQGENNCFKALSYFETSFGYQGYTLSQDLGLLGGVALVYFLFIILIDRGYFQKCERCFLAAPSEVFELDDANDESAAKEAEKVRKLVALGENVPKTTGLLVDGVSKNYGSVAAVSNVSFVSQTGDCFGVLGMNGAGKSSLFQILAGAQVPAVGDVYLMPNSLLGDRSDYLASLAYSPQRTSLILDLTGRQLLALYGSLRGLSSEWLSKDCQYWLAALGLEHDADRPCKDYSAGMQRRLCVATALIGDQRAILLDEPTAGVDPAGKQHLWNTLQRLQRIGKIIIVASHNVQECEILCRRIGLMIAGRMRYVESTPNIKKMFLNGYTVILRFHTKTKTNPPGTETSPVMDLRSEIEAILGECMAREAHQNMLRYLIPQREQNWGELFKKLETIRTSMSEYVESYSLTSSSLDEVFEAMAQLDNDATNILNRNRITCLQSCLMGKCCTDDYA